MAKATESKAQTSFILFTDIYRSSSLWERYPDEFSRALEAHNAIVEQAVESRGGEVMKNLGDGYIALFGTSSGCVEAMVDVEKGIGALPPLPDGTQLLLRAVAHGGPLKRLAVGRGYFGHALNRASRIVQVCNPGQALVSEAARAHLVEMPDGASFSELGMHYLRDLEEPEKLYQLNHPGFAWREFPPLATLKNRLNNLVCQPNSFIGREREMNELKGLVLEGKQRLITITAPGGYGKSRLATQLCANMLEDFENGVFEVLLAPVGSHERIVGTAASALGFQFYGKADPQRQLTDYLREKNLFLSFDNFEHVMEGKELLTEILKNAPKVSILVTSREPLRVQAEKVYPLAPLPVTANGDSAVGRPPAGRRPESGTERRGTGPRPTKEAQIPGAGLVSPAYPVNGKSPDDLPESLQLFIDRALRVKHDFALTEENIALASELCAKLEGVPLAIEMAAGWADSFTLAELLAEVAQQLELTSRMADVPQRQRSIRASLDWSYNLLSDDQASALRAVSAFKGGFFLQAAEAVACRAGGPNDLTGVATSRSPQHEPRGREVTRPESMAYHGRDGRASGDSPALQKNLRKTLAQLCDKGWLFTREALGKTRFFVRDAAAHEYAFEKLRESAVGRPENIAGVVTSRSPHTQRTRDLEVASPVISEYETAVRAHAEYFAELIEREGERLEGHRQLEALQILGVELENIYEALDTALARKDARLLLPFAKRLETYLGMVSRWQEGLAWYKRLVDVDRTLGDKLLLAYGTSGLGRLLRRLADYDTAEKLQNESLQIKREIGDRRGIAISLHSLGLLARAQGRYEEAEKLYNESLQISREIGDRRGIAMSLHNLGALARAQGRYEEAEKLYNESLQISREIGNRSGIAHSLNNLGALACDQGRYEEAEKLYNESLQIRREIGDRSGIATSLNSLGVFAYVQGRYEEAEKLWQESLQIFREIGGRSGIAMSLNSLGALAYGQGRYEEAEKLYNESLQIFREIGGRRGIANSLNNLGALYAKQGRLDEARMCLAEGVRIAKDISRPENVVCGTVVAGYLLAKAGNPQAAAVTLAGAQHQAKELKYKLEPMEQELLDEGMALVQAALSADELAALTSQGEQMTIDELADYALKALEEMKIRDKG